jgi:hypothetical protein
MQQVPSRPPRLLRLVDLLARGGLVLFPSAFRRQFGTDLEQVYHDYCWEVYQRQGWSGVLRLLPALLQDVVVGALGERLEGGKMMWHRFFARTVGSIRRGGGMRLRLVMGMLAVLCVLLALAVVPPVRDHQGHSAEQEGIRSVATQCIQTDQTDHVRLLLDLGCLGPGGSVATQCIQTTDHTALLLPNPSGSGYVTQPVRETCYTKVVLNGGVVVMLTPTFVLAGAPEPAYPTWPRCSEREERVPPRPAAGPLHLDIWWSTAGAETSDRGIDRSACATRSSRLPSLPPASRS